MEGCVVVLVAFDPFPVDCNRESIEFHLNVAKEIKIWLVGLQGLGAGYGVNC